MDIIRFFLILLLCVTAFFLIVLVLIQRGKGGGLAGALGGMGGQSAFGTKAGDLFTKITIGVAGFWIVLCVIAVKVLGVHSDPLQLGGPAPSVPGAQAPASTDAPPPADAPAAPAGKSEAPASSTGTAPAPEKTAPAGK